jgi:hypothetical protein
MRIAVDQDGACQFGGAGMPCPVCTPCDDCDPQQMPLGFSIDDDDATRH